MADKKISDLGVLANPTSTTVIPAVEGGVTYQTTLRNAVVAGAPIATATDLGVVKQGTGISIDATGAISSTTANLGGLTDTGISNLQDGDVLVYDTLTSAWKNQTGIDGGGNT